MNNDAKYLAAFHEVYEKERFMKTHRSCGFVTGRLFAVKLGIVDVNGNISPKKATTILDKMVELGLIKYVGVKKITFKSSYSIKGKGRAIASKLVKSYAPLSYE